MTRAPRRRLGEGVPTHAPFPRVDLFSKPTPLQHLPRFGAAIGANAAGDGRGREIAVWAKREDLMTVGLGGNKLRNLEFHVGAALGGGADTLVTAGRGSANHCRLTAAAAAQSGLRAVLVHDGPEPRAPGPNEQLSRLFGAELRYAVDATQAARDGLLEAVLDELRTSGHVPYGIGIGASGVLGASGQVLAGLELAGQLAELGISPDYVFVGAATGGTYAGIRVGLWLAGIATTIIAVPTHLSVAPSPDVFREHVLSLTGKLRDVWHDYRAPVHRPLGWVDQLILDDLSEWRPFGARSTTAIAAARLLGATEGIAADPVYTARVVAAVVAWAAAGRLHGKTVVLWIGGGTPALFEGLSASGPQGSVAAGPGLPGMTTQGAPR